jgi:hypothetical protein
MLPALLLGSNELHWVDKLKYLGVVFVAAKKFSVNVDINCKKFLGSAFAILQKCKSLSEEILCKLILTNCLPMLLYGIDSLFLKREQVRKLSVAFNSVFRRIFHMSRFTSMRVIYNFIGTMSLDCLYEERLFCLCRNCFQSESAVIKCCGMMCTARQEFSDICFKHDVHVNLSIKSIKRQIYDFFKSTLHDLV